MKLKNPFGMDNNNRIIHASELDGTQKGEMCGCHCPECGDPLIARIGNIKVKHFAHKFNADCTFSAESGMHMLAKEILKNNLMLMLPKVEVAYEDMQKVISNARNFKFSSADILSEKAIDEIRPDIIIVKNDKKLLVEIKVTHGIDEVKLEKITNMGLATIEIDLSSYFDGRDFDREEIKRIIIDQAECHKTWVYNKKIVDETLQLKKMYDYNQEKSRRKQIARDNYFLKRQKAYDEATHKVLEENPSLIYQADKEFHESKLWKSANKYVKLDHENLPCYLNYEIQGEMIFACDRRIWQTWIYASFIDGYDYRNLGKVFSIDKIVAWIKTHEKHEIPIESCLMKHRILCTNSDIFSPIMTYVLSEFIANLLRYGCVYLYDNEKSYTNKNRYFWKFEKNTNMVKKLQPQYRSNKYIEREGYLVNIEDGEIVGELRDLYV